MSFWTKLFGRDKASSSLTGSSQTREADVPANGGPDTSSGDSGTVEMSGKKQTGPICKGLSPEQLDCIQPALLQEIAALPVVRDNLLTEFWNRGPIDTVSGAPATADAVIAKVQEEARLIRQFVANIKSLEVTIEISEWFDGVKHDGPEGHVHIQMARRFRNGGVDLLFHHIVRTGDQTFKFAYMRL